jgi:signal peptidase I
MVSDAGSIASPASWQPTRAGAALPWFSVRRPTLYIALWICALSYAFLHWIVWPVKIDGDSMVPNYTDGQPAFINRLAYVGTNPQRGDVVGLKVGSELYIKRIIGLPGERIEFKRDVVFINGKALTESYSVRPLLWRLPPVQLGANEFFVMGDNRTMSKLGPIPRDQIIGKSMF